MTKMLPYYKVTNRIEDFYNSGMINNGFLDKLH